MERDWLGAAGSLSNVRRLFSRYSADDLIAQIDCELDYPLDDETDAQFVINILALGMVIGWTGVRLRSSLNVNQMFSGKEEKYYSQAAHLAQLRELNHEAQKELRQAIRDRGYFHNEYLDGDE